MIHLDSRLHGNDKILKENEADKYLVHDRYKDLPEVEKVFRGCKTVNPEVRPVYVGKKLPDQRKSQYN